MKTVREFNLRKIFTVIAIVLITAAVLIAISYFVIKLVFPVYSDFYCAECGEHTQVRDRLVSGIDQYLCDDCYISMTDKTE